MPKRQMSLVGFMQAGSTTVYAGSWRHPATEHGFLTVADYQDLGRTLEAGCFDLMFFDDRLAMPGIYGGSVADAVRLGARPVKLDLSVVLGAVAGVTQSIGLGATYSTTYYPPFHVARTFATLDHLSGGRAAWNVVTSVNDSEAQNYGFEQTIDHDQRYDRADEFLEATTALWDTWEDDALVLDRENGVFADPSKVHELNHNGKWFNVRGPLTVPRTPQGRPVLLQAGSSGRGRDFAARWAELIFTGDPGVDIVRAHYKDQKERIGLGGRDPETVKMCPMAYTVVAVSRSEAEEQEQMLLHDLVDPKASLTLLSELMNYDFSGLELDVPITDELIESVSGIRGLVQNLKKHIGGDTITLADLAGHRATLLQGPRFVGTAGDVADQMQEWFEGDVCDGFVIAATHVPGAYEDVVHLVVPELQRRGLFRDRYTGSTLREHLGGFLGHNLPAMGVNQRAAIVMGETEIAEFLEQSRHRDDGGTVGPTGHPHLVAMWYGLVDGKVYFETKAKSQKAVNLRRNPAISCSVEAGVTYDQLRGVAIEGTAVIIDDTTDDEYWAAGISVFERYNAPYTEETRPFVEVMMNKRVVVRIDPIRVRSWDHRKLGMDPMPLGGSTAQHL